MKLYEFNKPTRSAGLKKIKMQMENIRKFLSVITEGVGESEQEAFNEKLSTLKRLLQDPESMRDPSTKQAVQQQFKQLMAKAKAKGLDTSPKMGRQSGTGEYNL